MLIDADLVVTEEGRPTTLKERYLGRALVPAALRPRLRSLTFRDRKSLVLDPADRRFLVDYYRDDIRKLSSLLNRDLSAWES